MANILVSGHINIETTLRIESFPLTYFPVTYPFFGIDSHVSGVGYNIAKALTVLGNKVTFSSLIGQDFAGKYVRETLVAEHISDQFVLATLAQTAQSVILFDRDGRRQIHTDLKDIQEQRYPEALFEQAMSQCDLLVLCNINYSRPFLEKAGPAGKLIATDVHAISNLDDDYNQDFMRAANILFMSHENLPVAPELWAQQIMNRYAPDIVVIGLGSQGALLAVRDDNFVERIPAVQTRSVVSTIGAGDALFSAFVDSYLQSGDPYEAISKAIVFASYKIGVSSAAGGFLDREELRRLYTEIQD